MGLSINLKAVCVFLAMTAAAVFSGLVASTGSILLTEILIGVFGGVALLAAPRLSVWVLIFVGLMYGFFASRYPILSKLPWALALMSMLLMLPAAIKFIDAEHIPLFIWLALACLLYAVLTTLLQWESLSQLVAGFKRYFQMLGLMFGLALLAFKAKDHQNWLMLMLFIAVVQLPFTLYQRFMLGNLNNASAGAELTDRVAGTIGSSTEGGSSSAQMAVLLIMVVTFLVGRWRVGDISKSVAIGLSFVCLLPLGLGETKVVLLLLPLVWLVLMGDDIKKHTGRFVLQMAMVGLLVVVLGLIYLGLNKGGSGLTYTDILTQSIEYNFGKQGYGTYLLNRSTVISFWWDSHRWSDYPSLLFGHGLGSSYFTVGNAVAGHVAIQYLGYGIDLTSASSLLWDIGLFGFLLYVSMFVVAWISAGRLRKRTRNPVIAADAAAIQAAISMFILFIFYDNALVNQLSFELIYAVVLGYLGYLVRTQSVAQQALGEHEG